MTAQIPVLTGLLGSIDAAYGNMTASLPDVGTDPDTFSEHVVQFGKNVAKSIEILSALQQQLIAQIATNSPHNKRSISESKSIASLKILGSEKAEFKAWNEKLINALAQTMGTQWRKFIKELNEHLDQTRKVLTNQELSARPDAHLLGDLAKADDDLYYVLVEKTEGEAALRVQSGQAGEGMQAYQKIYLWFAGTSGLALSERTRMLMHPEAPKREEDIAEVLENGANKKDYSTHTAMNTR